MTIEREKLTAVEIERRLLPVLRMSLGLKETTDVRVGPTIDRSPYSWEIISMTPTPWPVAFGHALPEIRRLQGTYDLI